MFGLIVPMTVLCSTSTLNWIHLDLIPLITPEMGANSSSVVTKVTWLPLTGRKSIWALSSTSIRLSETLGKCGSDQGGGGGSKLVCDHWCSGAVL